MFQAKNHWVIIVWSEVKLLAMCGKAVRLKTIFAALFNKSNLFLKIDTSSGSEDEGSVQGDSQGTPTSSQGSINMEHWISQAIHGSTTSTTSSSSTQSGGSGAAHRLADVMAQTHIGEWDAHSVEDWVPLPLLASDLFLSLSELVLSVSLLSRNVLVIVSDGHLGYCVEQNISQTLALWLLNTLVSYSKNSPSFVLV